MNFSLIYMSEITNYFEHFFKIVFGPEKGAGSYPRYLYWLNGIKFSLEVTLLAALIGIAIGICIAMCKLSKYKIVRALASIYTDLIRGTPVLIQILFIYLVVFSASDLPKLVIGAIAFGINSGAYVAEIIRAGIQGLDRGQMEAARSLGMPYGMAMRHIIIPQAIRNILPTLVNEFIVLLKETSVIGYIAGNDILKATNTIISQTYSPVEPLITSAVIYLILTSIFTFIMRKIERRLRAGDIR
ncbi:MULTISPECIES: amino acid ABC transporter permease [Vallitalea]|nr:MULTISPECIES: amino acid ABC transporter permease [Vallitalea]MCT4685962.1 amino acid ABC transporter permease [Vallitalea sp.]